MSHTTSHTGHTRTNSSASSSTNTTHSCTTSPTPSTSPNSPVQLIMPSHSRENSLTGTNHMQSLSDVKPNNQTSVWINNRVLDSKLLKLERDCFQEPPTLNNDKENARLITNSEERTMGAQTNPILFKTLNGKIVKSVRAPGINKTPVPFQVGRVV